MEVLSKKELQDFLGVTERAICYHIKKGNFKPLQVKFGKYQLNKELHDIPSRLSNKTKIIFLKQEVLNYLKI